MVSIYYLFCHFTPRHRLININKTTMARHCLKISKFQYPTTGDLKFCEILPINQTASPKTRAGCCVQVLLLASSASTKCTGSIMELPSVPVAAVLQTVAADGIAEYCGYGRAPDLQPQPEYEQRVE